MYKFALFVGILVIATTYAQAPNEHDCRICEFIIAIARHHFHNNITNEADLKTQLLAECGHITNADDQTTCKNIVNNNIDKIYSDLQMGDNSGQTCVDINYCTPAETGFPTGMTRPPTMAPRLFRRRANLMRKRIQPKVHEVLPAMTTISPQLRCEDCDRFMRFAEYYYHRNPNATQAQMQTEMEHECQRNPADAAQCVAFIDAHIATIYGDLKSGKRPFQICEDLGMCTPGMFSSRLPEDNEVLPAMTTPSPQVECDGCDRFMRYAEYYYHRNPNATQAQMQTEMEHECQRNPAEAAQCVAFIDAHIATIYSDLKAGKRPFQICEDLGVCSPGMFSSRLPENNALPAMTTMSPQVECEDCDRFMRYAEYYYNRNKNATQAQMQTEMEHECQRNPSEAAQCVAWIDKNIATIYTDLVAGKRPFQICMDLGVCSPSMFTTMGSG